MLSLTVLERSFDDSLEEEETLEEEAVRRRVVVVVTRERSGRTRETSRPRHQHLPSQRRTAGGRRELRNASSWYRGVNGNQRAVVAFGKEGMQLSNRLEAVKQVRQTPESCDKTRVNYRTWESRFVTPADKGLKLPRRRCWLASTLHLAWCTNLHRQIQCQIQVLLVDIVIIELPCLVLRSSHSIGAPPYASHGFPQITNSPSIRSLTSLTPLSRPNKDSYPDAQL